MERRKRGFVKGTNEIAVKNQELCRADIMRVLGISSERAWRNHRDGKVKHSPAEIMAIEMVFFHYNVSPENVWDNQ